MNIGIFQIVGLSENLLISPFWLGWQQWAWAGGLEAARWWTRLRRLRPPGGLRQGVCEAAQRGLAGRGLQSASPENHQEKLFLSNYQFWLERLFGINNRYHDNNYCCFYLSIFFLYINLKTESKGWRKDPATAFKRRRVLLALHLQGVH